MVRVLKTLQVITGENTKAIEEVVSMVQEVAHAVSDEAISAEDVAQQMSELSDRIIKMIA